MRPPNSQVGEGNRCKVNLVSWFGEFFINFLFVCMKLNGGNGENGGKWKKRVVWRERRKRREQREQREVRAERMERAARA